MVPHEDDDPQSAGARLPVVIFEAPHSMMAEQLRQVRTRLQHSSSLDTIAQHPGHQPLAGRREINHRLQSGQRAGAQWPAHSAGGRQFPPSGIAPRIQSSQRAGIFRCPEQHGAVRACRAGNPGAQSFRAAQRPKPTNATELVESQLLVDFIERALEEFDHVIFDSGPLLFVSETVGLAPRVDGVITVVRARINTRGVLSRMSDMLKQIKAEHLGVVLNAVRAQGGGYYGRNIRTYYEYQNNGGRLIPAASIRKIDAAFL
jgi:hypothetical protein